MTKPSLSWIDRHKVSSLFDRLTSPKRSRSVEPASESAPPISARTLAPPTPIASPSPSSSTSSPTQAAPAASPVVLVPRPSTLPKLAPVDFQHPGGPLESRLERYVSWVAQMTSCDAVFVADENGLPVVSHAEDPVLIAVTAPCMSVFDQAWRAMGGPAHARRGRLVFAIEDDKLLHVAETGTPWGRFGVAVISPTTVPDDIMQCIQRGLKVALSEEEPQG
jgi:hypothetical protein